ncbi:hypothetical protein SRB5_14500 [Streptomyces sp. RB5]|uniref:Uncharacterized protein n=1 Tax=Streptomyces smaragdinus TaxID=2585196 RepID=A0A7K0CCZ4_9ACTN|nr:hypothetical protein [Streptomyces smaragdinus]MQY11335.1 hypothetical protein [Streptomyces smaragdinus]
MTDHRRCWRCDSPDGPFAPYGYAVVASTTGPGYDLPLWRCRDGCPAGDGPEWIARRTETDPV